MGDFHIKPGSPGEMLEHYGKKGMKWGVINEDPPAGGLPGGKITPGTPEFQQMIGRLTRTDHPQVLGATARMHTTKNESGKIESAQPEKQGLSQNQKMLIAFGAVSAAAAGYYAYQHYSGSKMPGLDLKEVARDQKKLDGMTLPKSWDVSGLKERPLSTSNLGQLSGGHFNAKLIDEGSLVVNTSRGYADILPKDGFSNPFAAEQHASVTRVLEEMRDKYPAIRNMNIEVIPMSRVQGVENSSAHMCVLPMRLGEARVMYNDMMDAPSAADIRNNAKFLPGLGKKDYVSYHEMGHLLAVAHGDLPPAFDILSGEAGPSLMRTRAKADPLLHKRTFAKFGFSFKELSKLSEYGATEPAEAMAELAGHYHHPEMRKKLTPDQLRRAKAMFDEMGGVT